MNKWTTASPASVSSGNAYMRTRDVYKVIKDQCQYCSDMEPEHQCDGSTFWNIQCPIFDIKSDLHKYQYMDAIKIYCSICQAIDKENDITECHNQSCPISTSGLNIDAVG